ncbi:MAG: glutamine amidotransferase [Alphaproteobacteria bacterium]|nr:glutamine amidotransferase [Alphaproteobacteria bacterium]
MIKTAIAIRHVHFEDLGAFDDVLCRHGYAVRYCDAGIDDIGEVDPLAPDLIIVLGGPIGAYQDLAYPFLGQELTLLERRLAAARPTLGICLGAQLMARALGARVYPAPTKEIGWGELQLSEAGRSGPLGRFAAVPVLHWHGDTFDLPEGTQLLASTEMCPNQAFSLGPHALACQFHPEISVRGFERWLIGHAVEIASTRGISPGLLRSDTERFAPRAARCGEAYLSEWLGALYNGRE